ncbi:hypothetical protein LCGC14_0798060 [marine sediment metagenome]|uniref:Uncharacterized protein n=1 Tax=marine sediment metagenome TaxID=412755 RepID=A0A0F9SXP6_9ZZZZ
MTLLVPLEDYGDIARQYRGTSACGAILGLLKEVVQQRKALAFAASVIKSGEPWTETCEREIGSLLSPIEADHD